MSTNGNSTKYILPIHLILGASGCAKAKVQELPRIGQKGEPVAELTRLGRVIISPGTEVDYTKMTHVKTSTYDNDRLCNLDILGIHDANNKNQLIHQEFKEQLKQDQEGWY